MKNRLLLGLILMTLVFSLALNAQVTKGSISGTVADATGAVIPDVQVVATDVQTGARYTTTSDKQGTFRFNLIPPGSYTVELSKAGFGRLKASAKVSSGQDEGLGEMHLAIGEVANTVEVTAEAPLLETTQAQVTNAIGTQELTTFAGVNENQGLDALALQVPGVVRTRSNNFSNSNGFGFSSNGLRGRNNDQQIDGQNNNDNSVGGPSLFLSNPEFVQEYQIVTNNFGPEYGRNAGSVVNVITKSGTNKVHGSIYGTENNSVLNSRTNIEKYFNKLKHLPRRNDEFGGATIGGPIKRDKVFFFTGFDQEIVSGASVFSTGSLTPTLNGLAQLSACYPNSTSLAALAKYGPFALTTGNPSASSLTTRNVNFATPAAGPGSGKNGYSLLAPVQCPNVEFASGLTRVLSTPAHIFDWVQRVDYQGSKDTFSGRYIMQRNNQFNATGTGSTGYRGNVPDFNQVVRLNETHNFTDHMTNDVAVSFGRANLQFGGGALGTIPRPGQLLTAVSSISTGSGNLGFGPANNLPQSRLVNTWQAQDNFNYLLGNHALKAGVNWTYQRSPNTFLPNVNGTWTYTSWANYAENLPNAISITKGTPTLDFREYDTFAYVGDDWKLKSNLTLNLGLTYSYYGQPATLFNKLTTAQQKSSSPFWDPTLPLSATTFPKLGAPTTSFAPSAGFAYTPKFGPSWFGDGKTVLRGGYRRSYDPPFYNIYLNIASSAPQVLALTVPVAGANTSLTPGQAIPQLPAVPTGANVRNLLAPYLVTGVSDPRRFNETTVSKGFGPDHVDAWSFGIQREFVKNTVGEVRYSGNHGGNLFQSIDGNPYIADLAKNFPNLLPSGLTPCSSANALFAVAVGRVNCAQGLQRIRTNTAYSDYHGLQAEVRSQNLFNQLNLHSAFTWSKVTDNASEIFGTGTAATVAAFAQNPLDYKKGEHGISGLNTPYVWTITAYEQIPFFKSQKGILGWTLGGWAVGGDYILASGQPYTPTQFSFAQGGGAGNYTDYNFNSAFSTVIDGYRPFLGSNSAPLSQVGAYAGDICATIASANKPKDPVCSAITAGNITNTTLLSFNAYNTQSGAAQVQTVNKGQVRYIMNSTFAQQVFGTPYGNVARNSVSDAMQNIANATITKSFRLTESVRASFHGTLQNAFNHSNYASVDPILDDAGLLRNGTGFGVPKLTDGGRRVIYFGAKFAW